MWLCGMGVRLSTCGCMGVWVCEGVRMHGSMFTLLVCEDERNFSLSLYIPALIGEKVPRFSRFAAFDLSVYERLRSTLLDVLLLIDISSLSLGFSSHNNVALKLIRSNILHDISL